MALPWAKDLDRPQLIRGAAKILAYHNEIAASQPHEWRIQSLAHELLAELHSQGYPIHADLLLFRETVQHYDLERRVVTGQEVKDRTSHVHIDPDTGQPCIHLMRGDSRACDKNNLLADAAFWLKREAHDRLQRFLRLDGAACSRLPLGPWQDHDPLRSATLRGALAALVCQQAYQAETAHNGPFLTLGRMWQVGRSLQETFIAPWQAVFEKTLNQETPVPLEGGAQGTWKFNRGEKQWTLRLCWAIVKQAQTVRLDCPPQLLPLAALRNRGELGLQAAIIRYLVDDPSGPRVRAASAARMLELGEHSVHQMLSSMRGQQPPAEKGSQLWDPFEESDSILIPVALDTSPSGRTSGKENRDDTNPPGGDQ